MRLLVVGHSYVTAFAQGKYAAMKKLDKQLEICLITPPKVDHVFMTYKQEVAKGLSGEEVVAVNKVIGKINMTYVLDPVALASKLSKFAPDHIHIEEDPHSFIGVEIVLLARGICPRASISFFIWDNLWRVPPFPSNVLKRWLTRLTLSRTALVVCGNQEGQRLLEKKGYFGQSLVLPQVGLDPEDYTTPPSQEIRQQFLSNPREALIGYIGRLAPEKGVLVLLEALSQIAHLPWRLLIVGSGELRELIQRYWQHHFGNRLICLGAVPHKSVPDYLKCLDVFVQPSYGTEFWKEQFGLTLAQAMLAGVACIGSSSGAIPDVLGPGGLIFKEKDVTELSSLLRRLLTSEALRRDLGEKARSFALERYTNSAVAGAYLGAFKNMNAVRY